MLARLARLIVVYQPVDQCVALRISAEYQVMDGDDAFYTLSLFDVERQLSAKPMEQSDAI